MIYINLLWLNFDGFVIYVRIVFASYMCHQVFVTLGPAVIRPPTPLKMT